VSRAEAIKLVLSGYFEKNAVDFISISDTNSEKNQMRDMWVANKSAESAAIFLNFADISSDQSGFTENKAKTIVSFVDESFRRKKDVIVHCFAGISRSGAVAKFVNEYFMLGDEYLESYAGHNHWVYYTLLEAANIPTLRSYYTNLEQQGS
jgi:protein tyrosine phosphatase